MFWLLFTLQGADFVGNSPIDFFSLAHFSIPVAVSIWLGYDFAFTNRALIEKLAEVEKLSVEKQQILPPRMKHLKNK